MTQPSSFSTLCTKSAAFELVGLLLSLSIYHTDATVYIVSDTETKKEIEQMTPIPKLTLVWFIELDKYSNYTRSQMEQMGIWSEFQMYKASVLEYALQKQSDSLLLDSDIIITGIIDDIDISKPLGVSPHYMRKDITDKYGYYNGGMIWVQDGNIVKDWREFTKMSRYYDQASIEDLAKKYPHFCFGSNYNIQGWRLQLHPNGPDGFQKAITINTDTNTVCYDTNPVKCIHTHFRGNTFNAFNTIMINKLNNVKMYNILCVIFRVLHGKWIIKIPKQPMSGLATHKNDSFRELPILWKVRNKDVDVVYDNNTMHCWLEPNILCYDRPTLQWMNKEVSKSSLLLLGNCDVRIEGKAIQSHFKNIVIKPWMFWPRKPMLVEKILKTNEQLHYEDRSILSIFIGNIENSVQKQYRDLNTWRDHIEVFHLTEGMNYLFTHEEYLMKIRDAKFGLCLRGYGSKCHREIELMAFGTVPIITPSVCIDSYMDPPIENIHYIKVSVPNEVEEKLKTISKEQWESMSKACYNWYQRNVYSENSWKNMIENILYK